MERRDLDDATGRHGGGGRGRPTSKRDGFTSTQLAEIDQGEWFQRPFYRRMDDSKVWPGGKSGPHNARGSFHDAKLFRDHSELEVWVTEAMPGGE